MGELMTLDEFLCWQKIWPRLNRLNRLNWLRTFALCIMGELVTLDDALNSPPLSKEIFIT